MLWEDPHRTDANPAGTIEATGKRISALATLWITFEGDKAREITHHLDVLAMLQQVGALPQRIRSASKPPEDRPQGVISLRLEPVQKMPLGRAS